MKADIKSSFCVQMEPAGCGAPQWKSQTFLCVQVRKENRSSLFLIKFSHIRSRLFKVFSVTEELKHRADCSGCVSGHYISYTFYTDRVTEVMLATNLLTDVCKSER